MFKIYKLIGMVVLAMTMPICLLANGQDTTTYLSDANGKEISEGDLGHVAKRWKENNLWHVMIFSYPEKVLQLDCYYDNIECKKKEGFFKTYYENGKVKDSGQYLQDKEEGQYCGWYETGEPMYILHYKHGILVDTSAGWFKNGQKNMLATAEKNGTVTFKEYREDGKTRTSGHFVGGKKEGIWIYTDSNQIVSQKVRYEADSAMIVTNYSEKGIEENGIKVIERGPQFPGGLKGWRRFLERNLQYPEIPQRKGIQGVIRISLIVNKEGNVTDYKVLGHPDKDLAQEALRIMSISPKWIPAVQHNRKVTYRFMQTVTFQLQ